MMPRPNAKLFTTKTSRAVAGLAVASALFVLTACGNQLESTSKPVGTLESNQVSVVEGIVYRTVDGQSLTANACTPNNRSPAAPAVLVVHGGGFQHGSNEKVAIMDMCRSLAKSGMVGFAVNYRLAPAFPFPAAVEDLQSAVEWLRQPAQVNRFNIDPGRIGAIGGSAGGNLAMEIGTIGSGPTNVGSRISAVVSFSGPSDMTAVAKSLGALPADRIQIALEYLDCVTLEQCPQAREASPRYNVDATDPPMLLMHSADERIPVEQAEVMAVALQESGIPVTLRVLEGDLHAFAYVDDAITAEVIAFLEAELGPQ